MRIGVDFDNTIVCYDRVFHRVAVERALVPPDVPPSKGDVRDYLRSVGREDAWIELQGYVYGARMEEADPYPGVIEFLLRCRRLGVPVCVVSHKTRRPFQGPNYDLHDAAQKWLRKYSFYDPTQIGLSPDHVSFELTKQGKVQRIYLSGCTHFIDDLPEFLSEPDFPASVERILFDPNDLHAGVTPFPRATSWADLEIMLLGRSELGQ